MFGATNATGRPDLIGPALSALNVGQLPATLLLLIGRDGIQAWPYMACGALALACMLGLLLGSGWFIVVAAGVLGFSCGTSLTLLLALPPLLSAPGDTHRMTAGIFTISYTCAVIVPVVSGVSWDASGIPATAFIPIGLANLLLIGLAPTVRGARHPGFNATAS